MAVGMVVLAVVAILVLFGVGQRVLDRMRLTDRQALLWIALIFVGGWIPSIPLGDAVRVNIGGALIPLGLCVYLFAKAGTAWERWRTIIAIVVTTAAVYLIGMWFPNEPEMMPFDVNYLYGIVAGVVAYILGRSRIGSFIAGVMGILLADILQALVNNANGVPVNLNLGGGGALDAVVISGFLAVILSEVVGTLLEKMVGEKKTVEVDGEHMTLKNVEEEHDHEKAEREKQEHEQHEPQHREPNEQPLFQAANVLQPEAVLGASTDEEETEQPPADESEAEPEEELPQEGLDGEPKEEL